MDSDTTAHLAQLVHSTRVAHLATLRQGAPLASMVLFLPEADFSAFYVRVSRLAWHTQDMLLDARVALSITETDDGRDDPQTLARVVIRGAAAELGRDDGDLARLRETWLSRYAESAITFELADFAFWRITPGDARFVAGFARTFNLSAAALRACTQT